MTAKGLVCEMQTQSADPDTLSQLGDHGHMPPRYYNTVQMKANKTQTHTRLSTFPLLVRDLGTLEMSREISPETSAERGVCSTQIL